MCFLRRVRLVAVNDATTTITNTQSRFIHALFQRKRYLRYSPMRYNCTTILAVATKVELTSLTPNRQKIYRGIPISSSPTAMLNHDMSIVILINN